MEEALNQSIIELRSKVNDLKYHMKIIDDNSTHLLIRSEITLSLISAMIADGLIKCDGLVKYADDISFDLPAENNVVADEKKIIIKILGAVRKRC